MLYTKKQTDLLRESMGKWESIVDGTGVDKGIDNCALCGEYYVNINWIERCKECPISKLTDVDECFGTPYWDWVDANLEIIMPYRNVNDETMYAAKEELKFLEDLYNKTILFRKLEV